MAKVYAFVADGLEEVECLAVWDILLRAEIDVKLVSIMGRKEITGAHGLKMTADLLFEEIENDADLLFLPGGMPGTKNLSKHKGLGEMLKAHAAAGKHLAAICAAPSVLGELGIIDGHKATCYPGWEYLMPNHNVTNEYVVTDRNITTARGMGSSIQMGLQLVKVLKGELAAKNLKESIQYFEGDFLKAPTPIPISFI